MQKFHMGDLLFGLLYRFTPDVAAIYHILSLFGISVSLAAKRQSLAKVIADMSADAILWWSIVTQIQTG